MRRAAGIIPRPAHFVFGGSSVTLFLRHCVKQRGNAQKKGAGEFALVNPGAEEYNKAALL